ncbi:hypothetical protein C8T65DRAFT_606163, partial [Cerioporus squamosus]
MEHSRLPIELCEQVIDCVKGMQPWWDRHQLAMVYRTSIHASQTPLLDDLLACARTCHAWYPCARVQLYHTVAFKFQHQVDLFIRSIHENPPLADLVRELIVHLTGERYIPSAQGTLFKTLGHLRTVAFSSSGYSYGVWLYPPHHHTLVTQFPLTDLIFGLNTSNKSMLFCAFRVVWSLRELRSLTVVFSGGFQLSAAASDILVRVRSLRRSWSCAKLRVLTIRGELLRVTMSILPSCPFGTAVEQLALHLDEPLSYNTNTD